MSNTNTTCLEVLGIHYTTVIVTNVDDAYNEYIVTSDTGEGTFAYDASDITAESVRLETMCVADQHAYDYSGEFCNAVAPVEDCHVARAVLAETGYRICRNGSCVPIV